MKLAALIEIAHRRAHREWVVLGPKLGLTYSEYTYLSAIKDQEIRKTDKTDHGQHLQDVVAEMGVKKASASAMVVKLEERGLVERVPCQFDARAQHILLTPDGQACLEQGRSVYETAAQLMMSEMTDSSAKALEAALAEHDDPA